MIEVMAAKEIGARIRRLRVARGMNQQELIEAVGMDHYRRG
jgi:transcriptional regulator with XRE-family HTH domain